MHGHFEFSFLRDKFIGGQNGYLIKLFGHLADDLCVLHVPEHFDPHGTWLQRRRDRCLTWGQQASLGCTLLVLPLHPEHWMKKLMRSNRAKSLSCLYDSIHSSTTDCKNRIKVLYIFLCQWNYFPPPEQEYNTQ